MTNRFDIFAKLKKHAPIEMQASFDNAGFLVGEQYAQVSGILLALDITQDVVLEAIERNCDLIVAHHPLIFDARRSITDGDGVGRTLLTMIEHRIGAICMHTNLDAVQGGVNDVLAQVLHLQGIEQLSQEGVDENGNPYGIGRTGYLQQPSNTVQYAMQVKAALQANGVRYYDAGRPVHYVAVGGGSCGSMLSIVIGKGCDTFVTSDLKYDVFLEAKAMDLNLIDAGHYATEQVVMQEVERWLKEAFPGLPVLQSKRHGDVISFL